MTKKIFKLIESQLVRKQAELKELQHSFQTYTQLHIGEMSFEHNAMQTLMLMQVLKAEIELLNIQFQTLSLQQSPKEDE